MADVPSTSAAGRVIDASLDDAKVNDNMLKIKSGHRRLLFAGGAEEVGPTGPDPEVEEPERRSGRGKPKSARSSQLSRCHIDE